MSGALERGIELVEAAVERCPSFAWAVSSLALLQLYHRRSDRAIELGQTALRLNPRDPQSFRAEMAIAGACYDLGRLEDCLHICEHSLQKAPEIQFFNLFRIICLVQLGREQAAAPLIERFVERYPKFTVGGWSARTRMAPDPVKRAGIRRSLQATAIPD
ncbi:tetratricopeptide repeat protein [Rhodobacteraceae bacterium NNCM2]|nr:tetratricopeptide repeat protein [Coraliihabitans acroporae]